MSPQSELQVTHSFACSEECDAILAANFGGKIVRILGVALPTLLWSRNSCIFVLHDLIIKIDQN